MHSPDGRAVQVPYSKVHDNIQNGYLFSDKGTLQQYARDLSADPMSETRVDKFLQAHPWIAAPVNALAGMGTEALRTATGLDKTPTSRLETELQLDAATPNKGLVQNAAGVAENAGEFFSGEELLGLVGRTGKAAAEGLGVADRMKDAAGVAQFLTAHPTLARLLKIGTTAVKQGTIAGGQTYAKTGGDMRAAGQTAELTAGGGAAIEAAAPAARAVAGTLLPKAAGPGTAEYANQARAALQRAMDGLNVHPQIAQEAVDQTHDLTGAAANLKDKILNPIYDNLNKLTDGKFRALNSEVQTAKRAARGGDPQAVAAYQGKLAEMDQLLDSFAGQNAASGGKLQQLTDEIDAARQAAQGGDKAAQATYKAKLAERQAILDNPTLGTDFVQKVKTAWRQQIVLEDVAGRLDRNINGVPGATQASQAQRGIDGKGMMRSLQGAVKTYGRKILEETLGRGRLENLEAIARANQTAPQRVAFNKALHEVTTYLPMYAGWKLGESVAGPAGGVAGSAAGALLRPAAERALEMVRANPQIGQNLLFAVESGAKPENYGPMIAGMMVKAETDSKAANDAAERDAQQRSQEGTQ